jgi:chromosomal replication initiation ATPase DnaA
MSRILVSEVVDEVCRKFGVTKELLFGKRRTQDVVQIRQILYLLCDNLCDHQSRYYVAGQLNKHHTTYRAGLASAARVLAEEPELAKLVAAIQKEMRQRHGAL